MSSTIFYCYGTVSVLDLPETAVFWRHFWQIYWTRLVVILCARHGHGGCDEAEERRESGQNDLLRARLDQIVDPAHPLSKLARTIDWSFLEARLGAVYTDRPGRKYQKSYVHRLISILHGRLYIDFESGFV